MISSLYTENSVAESLYLNPLRQLKHMPALSQMQLPKETSTPRRPQDYPRATGNQKEKDRGFRLPRVVDLCVSRDQAATGTGNAHRLFPSRGFSEEDIFAPLRITPGSRSSKSPVHFLASLWGEGLQRAAGSDTLHLETDVSVAGKVHGALIKFCFVRTPPPQCWH